MTRRDDTPIRCSTQEKAKIQKDLSILTDRLSKINEVGVSAHAPTPHTNKRHSLNEDFRCCTPKEYSLITAFCVTTPSCVVVMHFCPVPRQALARKVQARNEYDKTIQETEAAYMKILESSQTLLHGGSFNCSR